MWKFSLWSVVFPTTVPTILIPPVIVTLPYITFLSAGIITPLFHSCGTVLLLHLTFLRVSSPSFPRNLIISGVTPLIPLLFPLPSCACTVCFYFPKMSPRGKNAAPLEFVDCSMFSTLSGNPVITNILAPGRVTASSATTAVT